MLKGYVERDKEVERLGREVERLRVLVKEAGGGEGEQGEEEGVEVVDLEKDLDAVEKLGMGINGEPKNGVLSNVSVVEGDDVMDEGMMRVMNE